MKANVIKREKAIAAELSRIGKQENHLSQLAGKAKPALWKAEMEKKIPEKVYTGLESAFCKGFSVVFHQGIPVIEQGFDKESLQADHAILDYAIQVKGTRKEFQNMRKSAQRANWINLAATTVEGIGLGALGIGMPDIVLFLGMLLKGIYETALYYGYDYTSRQEQVLILKMMAAALSSGQEWTQRNQQVDSMLEWETVGLTETDFQEQLHDTASVFAMDMLLLKFLQGLPVVGILGGAANPLYYHKVMKYVQLKYRKRYLLKQRGGIAHV